MENYGKTMTDVQKCTLKYTEWYWTSCTMVFMQYFQKYRDYTMVYFQINVVVVVQWCNVQKFIVVQWYFVVSDDIFQNKKIKKHHGITIVIY